MWIGHLKEIRKLTSRVLAPRRSEVLEGVGAEFPEFERTYNFKV